MQARPFTTKATGLLFILAIVTSLTGGGILESVITAPDYLQAVAGHESELWTGVWLEIVNGIAVIGIAVLLFPILKPHGERMALWYLLFRILEAVFCILAAVLPIWLLDLSQAYVQAVEPDTIQADLYGQTLLKMRTHMTGMLIPFFFGISALLLYYQLYMTRLLPRFIALWGFAGVILILALNLIPAPFPGALFLALPIILNELFIGAWLIIRGFSTTTKT
ncbi:MAG: DUF4386 domain-containing protein [Bacteroidetes bacterium]|nr:MAG: DUF4386 domain-containing protein [Bacteroidota bacterium]